MISSSSLVSSVAVLCWSASVALMPLLVAVIVPSPPATLSTLYKELSGLLPSAAVPDKIVFVDELPINSHGENLHLFFSGSHIFIGKLDMNQLSSISKTAPLGLWSPESLRSLIATSTAEVLNISWRPENSTLSALGASSFDVLRILNFICDKLQTNVLQGRLYEALLTEPLNKVVTIFCNLLDKGDDIGAQGQSSVEVMPVPAMKEPSAAVDKVVPSIKTWRRGQVLHNGRFVSTYIMYNNLCSI